MALVAKGARGQLSIFSVKALSFENFDDLDVGLRFGKAGVRGVGKIFNIVTVHASGVELARDQKHLGANGLFFFF